MILYLLPFITAFTSGLAVWSAYIIILSRSGKQKIIASVSHFIYHELGGILTGSRISDSAVFHKLTPTIGKHLDDFLKIKLQQKLPVIATFMGESTFAKIKQGMMEEIEILLPEIIEQYTENLQEDKNVRAYIDDKLNAIVSKGDTSAGIMGHFLKIALIVTIQSFIIGAIISLVLLVK